MSSTTNEIVESLAKVDVHAFKNDQERILAINSIRLVLASWMKPIEHIFELTWIQPAYLAALKVTVDTDLYTKWIAKGGTSQTTKELSELSGLDEKILVRLLRHIVAMNALIQPTPNTYALTPFTRSLAGPGNQDAFRIIFEQCQPAFLNLPSFLAKQKYEGPLNPAAGNWQDLHGTDKSFIEWLWQDSERAQGFHRVMMAYNSTTPDWVNIYPSEKLLKDAKPGRPLVVDIGGSTGADLMAFQRKHPNLPDGSLVSQDLEGVIRDIPVAEGITPMIQDVFNPQAVKGARCYLMHYLLHGFNDEQSLKALQNLAAALEPGYSKILLHEMVVDDENLVPAITAMDLNMMSLLSGTERTKQDWTRLINQAGLKVVGLYSDPTIHESIIEAELA